MSAGMDMGVAIIQRLWGEELAQQVALRAVQRQERIKRGGEDATMFRGRQH